MTKYNPNLLVLKMQRLTHFAFFYFFYPKCSFWSFLFCFHPCTVFIPVLFWFLCWLLPASPPLLFWLCCAPGQRGRGYSGRSGLCGRADGTGSGGTPGISRPRRCCSSHAPASPASSAQRPCAPCWKKICASPPFVGKMGIRKASPERCLILVSLLSLKIKTNLRESYIV